MAKLLQLDNKTNITIDKEPFGFGGSGEVYKILSPANLTNQVVKLYYKEKLTKQSEDKIQYLVLKKINQGEHESIVWIKNVVFDNGRFVGFTMNYADGIGLEQFLNDRWWRKNEIKDWDKFKLENENGIEYRIKLCLNIAIAVNIIHKNRNYTIADIKPSNFKIHKSGIVSIVDIDNIEIVENGKVLYAAQVITPDFSPPEFHKGLNYKQSAASQNWDRYSLGILFYNILCGIHPFVGVGCTLPYDGCTDSPDLIKNGIFLHGKNRHYVNFSSPQHSNFPKLSLELQARFIQCFDDGHDDPHSRPSAEDWCKTLADRESIKNRPLIAELLKNDAFYNEKFTNAMLLNGYSPALILKSIDVNFSEIKFQDFSNSINIYDKIVNIFNKRSSKQIIIDELTGLKKDINIDLNEQLTFKSDITYIASEFELKQQKILSNEKVLIEKLKKELQLNLNEKENVSKILQIKESKELFELQSHINSLIYKEDSILADFHSSTYRNLLSNFDNKRLEYQAEINLSEIEKKKEIEKLIKFPSKLSQFNIEKECRKIFNTNLPSLITTLKELNFYTAADFSEVYGNGYLRNNLNQDIRIPGMGAERSKKLFLWKLNIEKKEDDKIIREVSLRYNIIQKHISLEWSIFEKNHFQTISPLNIKFKTKEEEIRRNKNKLIENKKNQIKVIILKFDKNHDKLIREFIDSINKFYKELEDVNLLTKNSQINSFSVYKDKIKKVISRVDANDLWIKEKMKKYNSLCFQLKNSNK